MTFRGATLFCCLFMAAAAAGLGLPACASIPEVPVSEGSRIVIRLYEAENGVELALANESYPELSDLYSRARSDASMKRAPDRLVGQLLASLEATGMGLYQRDGAPDELNGKQSYLLVDQDGRQRHFNKPGPGASAEERRAYSLAKLTMSEYYSHVGGAQHVARPEGAQQLFRTTP